MNLISMKRINLVLFILSFLFLMSCNSTDSDSAELVELHVNHYLAVASGPFPGLFHLTQSGEKIGSDEWDIQYSPITNFDFEWGYRYKILAEKEKYYEGDDILMDAPPYKYVLIEELSKTKVNADSDFEILLQRAYDDGGIEKYVQGNLETGFKLLGSKSFDCADLCDELSEKIGSGADVVGVFKHRSDGMIILTDL